MAEDDQDPVEDAGRLSGPEDDSEDLPQLASLSLIGRREPGHEGIRWRWQPLLLLVAFGLGLGSGYLAWGNGLQVRTARAAARLAAAGAPLPSPAVASPAVRPPAPAPTLAPQPTASARRTALMQQINPAAGFTLPATYGDIGPRLVAAGAIDLPRFTRLYVDQKQPLTAEQQAILSQGSAAPVTINAQNAYFLLNLFWAFGLTNSNPLLDSGPMKTQGKGDIVGFASTGGWTMATIPVEKLYSSTRIVTLTSEQQARLEEVAKGVYRPCCGNPTSFPDCNHGMALLGMLELMAAQDATVDQMFTAARQVNAFWFPSQSLEIATYFDAVEGTDFDTADDRRFVGVDFMSGTGFSQTHKWLASNGLLDQSPRSGSNCGV